MNEHRPAPTYPRFPRFAKFTVTRASDFEFTQCKKVEVEVEVEVETEINDVDDLLT
jgi:hypothetical protein